MSAASLTQVQLQMIRIGIPICVSIGNLDCILGLFVFFQKRMRKSPCILYLIGYMLSNLVYIDFTVLTTLLSGYGMDMSVRSTASCCIRMYISFVFSAIPSYLLVMASMDRMFISSSNVQTRLQSNRRFALLMIGAISIFWALFHLHAFFFSEIQLTYGVRLSCNTQPGGPATFVSYYGLINAIIPISLMAGFGIRTLVNIRRARRNHVHAKDRRIIAMLIVQLGIYICLRLPVSLDLVYGQITKSNFKTSNQVLIEQFVYFVAIFCQFVQVSISPLMNLITKSFRSELKRAVSNLTGRTQRQSHIDTSFSQTRHLNTIKMREMTVRSRNTHAIKPMQQQVEIEQN
jgi:hypothetical protein